MLKVKRDIMGGLETAIYEVTSEDENCIVKRIGIEDRFGQSSDMEELMEEYGLTSKNIYETALNMMCDREEK